jgi:biotin transport system substrate-specific component
MNRVKATTIRLPFNRREAIMAGWALAFAALTGIGALLRVHLFPVPVTMQVFFVLLAGLLLGPRWGAASQLAYLAMGACGAPFFAAPPHAGLTVLFGPTGGYLWGFVAGAFMAGLARDYIVSRGWGAAASTLALFAAGLAATSVIYLCGTAWLSVWLGSISSAWRKGVLPFILPDAVKSGGAAAVASLELAKRRGRRKRLS